MQTTVNQIKTKIKNHKRGKIFFIDDFIDLGTFESVKKSLQRLTNSGFLVRLARGIYWYPKKEKELFGMKFSGKPTLDEIAKTIAKRDNARIVPTGVYALNRLGLCTQVPANCVYLTDGSARRIRIGNGKGILLKHTSPKNLAFKSDLAMLITFALKELGEGNVTQDHLNKLKWKLKDVPKEIDIMQDAKLMPEWIRKLIPKFWR
jgi:hypothetical protein